MTEIFYKLESKPKKAYLNITSQCTNSCIFCRNNPEWERFSNLIFKDEEEPPILEIIGSLEKNLEKPENKSIEEIIFCGVGEPLRRFDDVLKIITEIKKYEKYDIKTRVNTNGQVKIWEKNPALRLKNAGLDAINISANASDTISYNFLCNPRLIDDDITDDFAFNKIIDFIQDCKRVGLETEITALKFPKEYFSNQPGIYKSILETEELAKRLGVKFRWRSYHGKELKI